jgi:hypothetical protein
MPSTLHSALESLSRELVDGTPAGAGWMLNPNDPGLLRSLDKLTAAAASVVPASGGASIAAHVDHVRYGLSLLNRWAHGESNPWETADWSASWTRVSVSDAQWAELRQSLAAETTAWIQAMGRSREYSHMELMGVIASLGHLAYHLGAIRQIDRSIRGPAEGTGAPAR